MKIVSNRLPPIKAELGSPVNPVKDLTAITRRVNHPVQHSTTALAEMLHGHGLINKAQADSINALPEDQAIQKILEKNWISSRDLTLWQAYRMGVAVIELRGFRGSAHIVQLIPGDFARKFSLVPVAIVGERLVVAMTDPTNHEALHYLEFYSGHTIELMVAHQEEIEFTIARFYGEADDAALIKNIGEKPASKATQEQQELERLSQTKPTVRLVHNILSDAIVNRASDIHLRPQEEQVNIYFRIDGQLIKMRSFEKHAFSPVLCRIKIIAGMDIAERRLPQDGRAKVVSNGHEVDLRISVIPSVNGESVVIRILDTQAGLRSLKELGFNEEDNQRFRNLIEHNHGLLLVTGPTGSGKSTTLYAALNTIKKRGVNIITVEDPVEYRLEGVTQIQVQPQIEYNFSRALRHILRHDPDVIMVGEVRDTETAKMAVESALTGHLVMSTLHTNDAASTITRLLEIGLAPYMINASVIGVLAQRLVRRNCPNCGKTENIDPYIRKTLGINDDEIFTRGEGCEYCHQTGYRGRVAVYELLSMSPQIKAIIRDGVHAEKIESLAIKEGMIPLTQQAISLARTGITSLEEVYRVRLG